MRPRPARPRYVTLMCVLLVGGGTACGGPIASGGRSDGSPSVRDSAPVTARSVQVAPTGASPLTVKGTDPLFSAAPAAATEFLTALDPGARPEGLPAQLGYGSGGDGPACMFYFEDMGKRLPTGLAVSPVVNAFFLDQDVSLCLYPRTAIPVAARVRDSHGRETAWKLTRSEHTDTSSPYYPMIFRPSLDDPAGRYDLTVTVEGGGSVSTSFVMKPPLAAGPHVLVLNEDAAPGMEGLVANATSILIGINGLHAGEVRPVRVYRVVHDGLHAEYLNTFFVTGNSTGVALAAIPLHARDRGAIYVFYLGSTNPVDARDLVKLQSFMNMGTALTSIASVH